jgi:hypothetical protein
MGPRFPSFRHFWFLSVFWVQKPVETKMQDYWWGSGLRILWVPSKRGKGILEVFLDRGTSITELDDLVALSVFLNVHGSGLFTQVFRNYHQLLLLRGIQACKRRPSTHSQEWKLNHERINQTRNAQMRKGSVKQAYERRVDRKLRQIFLVASRNINWRPWWSNTVTARQKWICGIRNVW